MNSDAVILQKLFRLTRGDLDSAVFPVPDIPEAIGRMRPVRLARVSRFWTEEAGGESLSESTHRLVTGLYGQEAPWMFALRGRPRGIECWFGTAGEADRLIGMLRSAYPDCRIGDHAGVEPLSPGVPPESFVVCGIPAHPSDPSLARLSPADRLIRGMLGADWLYLVLCQPLVRASVLRAINETTAEIRDIRATYLLKTSAIDETDRTAERYVELLNKKLERLERARWSGFWDVRVIVASADAAQLALARSLVYSAFSAGEATATPLRCCPCSRSATQMPEIEPLTGEEATVLACPPADEYPGYEVVDYARFGVDAGESSKERTSGLSLGAIIDRGLDTGNRLRMPYRNLAKHALMSGVTGSGKSNTCLYLLQQLWNEARIPFLVIESAKSEYRALLAHIPEARVFTAGDETIAPLRLNPMEAPAGTLMQTHIDYLKSLFSAAFVLYPPMPYVLEQSIQEVYEDRGWNLAANRNARGETSARSFPTLGDLADKVAEVVGRMGYDQRTTMDVKAGLLARLNQLRLGGGKGPMFDTRRSTDIEHLFGSPCVLELKSIVSDDEKAFLIGLLLIRLYEQREAEGETDSLRHVTLIEEAHRLLRNTTTEQGSEVAANPRGRAIEVFANILSEIRAFGEGILIAEQIPAKLTPDAIKNTNLKLVHRLVAEDDRRLVGNSMNLDEAQTRALALLRVGEAVAFTDGLNKAALVRVPLADAKSQPEKQLAAVVSAMRAQGEKDAIGLLPFPGCSACPSAQRGCSAPSVSTVWGLEQLLLPFVRLFNAVRLHGDNAVACLQEFTRLADSQPSHQTASHYCLMLRLFEREIDRRGQFFGWSWSELERAVETGSQVLLLLNGQIESAEATVSGCALAAMADFSNLMRKLHENAAPPYAGCAACRAPCQYRYDIESRPAEESVRDFQSAQSDRRRSLRQLFDICRRAVSPWFPRAAVNAAALCFAVQKMHRSGLRSDMQEQAASRFAAFVR